MAAPAEGSLVDIDEHRLGEMLALVGPASESRLLRSLIRDLRAARAGLARAIEQRDIDLLHNQTHVLASLAGTFGAPLLTAAVQELELRSRSEPLVLDGSGVLTGTERVIAHLKARLGGRRP